MSTHSSRNSNLWIGLIVITVGFILLLDRMDIVYFPYWLFSWPLILIAVGLIIGIKKKFKSIEWLILVLIGSFFLFRHVPGFEYLRYYGLPIGIITVGLFLLFRASVFRSNSDSLKKKVTGNSSNTSSSTEIFGSSEQETGTGEEYIDLTTIFGAIKKKIFSKNFKGGQTTNFFGGTEIDLTQADFEGRITLDIVQAFGGVKLIVPSNWEVQSDVTTILGGIEDKRTTPSTGLAANKKLVLTGTCMLGGIDIRSY